MIYLDNAATTQVSQRVVNAMLPYFTEMYGNAGSIHTMGADAAKAMQKAREQCARPINADPEDIIFTSGGSEANTLAIVGLAKHLISIGKTHVITTPVEHPSVLEAMKYLFYSGFEVEYLSMGKDGELDTAELTSKIRKNTGLVSVMAVNNETGNSYDIQRIGAKCKKYGIFFHTDCVQAYGTMDIDVERDHIDFLSVSGHKFHAPKGVGFLYAKHKELLQPIILGGGQEQTLRSGTENVPSIVGMGEAAEAAFEDPASKQENADKRKLFLSELTKELGGVRINGCPHDGSKTINLFFDGVDGETLLLLLNNRGIVVSAGSACSAHSAVPSHVLTAIGLSDDEARSSIRVSFSVFTTNEEICEAAHVIADSVKKLQRR